MLPKKQRLSRKEVEILFEKGEVFHSKNFVLKTRKNRLEQSRFCITFSKKLSLKAHERNTIRRRIYEAIRKNIELAPSGTDVAFIAKPSLMKLPRKELESSIKETLTLLQSPHG